ncbi:hypothetical protein RSal33209_3530 [Renibacterium salmoninarum ATCC 33209]|uniref:Uncharacterized protein n=1 Tax=Renibacterium salmoninarum (strain ATCC 33209 / DSM 20767 / JCM 11484 / NBRC 15589 / NCIMB 2235) TaxID=288705 RepID=A9WVL8_RENSM|nr:hypothetical protein RSal33209_3530 [Renibacterium salmoninarum ATCC 33209]
MTQATSRLDLFGSGQADYPVDGGGQDARSEDKGEQAVP